MALFRITALVITLSLGLSACSAMKERRAERRAEKRAAIAAEDRAECITMGFNIDTDAFRLCLDNRKILRQSIATEQAANRAIKAANRAKNAADAAASAADDAATAAAYKSVYDGG